MENEQRNLSKRMSDHDFLHAETRRKVFADEGLHPGVHDDKDLSAEGLKVLVKLREEREALQELAREARKARGERP